MKATIIVAVSLLAAGTAAAQDSAPPEITHPPCPNAAPCDQIGDATTGRSVEVIRAYSPGHTDPGVAEKGVAPTVQQSAIRVRVRLEPGAAILLGKPQSEVFDLVGGGCGMTVGIAPPLSSGLHWLSIGLAGGYVYFPGDGRRSAGSSYILGGGLRLTPLKGDGTYVASPYLAAFGGLARTGRLSRAALDVSFGIDLLVGSARVGPFVRYYQIFDKARSGVVGGDALLLVAGVGAGIGDVRKALVPDESPAPAEPAPPRLPPAPGVTDEDGDGIPDVEDTCPSQAEDRDGFEDQDGCPEIDNDADGLADDSDSCPDLSEDRDGFEDDDGCPDRDNDADGIADPIDDCPDEAEVYNSVEDHDGCPDAEQAQAYISAEKESIVIEDRVYFKTASDRILKKSHSLLDQVARILNDYPHIKKVRIDGHTDDRGTAAMNQNLSKRRAQSVMAYLILKGVDKSRLAAMGWGKTRPLVRSRTKMARKINRRVEFIILEQDELQIPGPLPAP